MLCETAQLKFVVKSSNEIEMNSSVKGDEVQKSSSRDSDNKLRLFEKIVYFVSGSIGDEVSTFYACVYELDC